MHDSSIISFFEMRCPDSEGRMLDEILNKQDDWFEFCHDYIQWLFPLQEPSQFNPDAPLLTQEDIDYFKNPESVNLATNYIAGIERMFSFFGLKVRDNNGGLLKLESASNFDSRKHTWAEGFTHNHLRITRMITSMKLLGFSDYAYALYDYVSDFTASENSKKYWEDAINA